MKDSGGFYFYNKFVSNINLFEYFIRLAINLYYKNNIQKYPWIINLFHFSILAKYKWNIRFKYNNKNLDKIDLILPVKRKRNEKLIYKNRSTNIKKLIELINRK